MCVFTSFPRLKVKLVLHACVHFTWRALFVSPEVTFVISYMQKITWDILYFCLHLIIYFFDTFNDLNPLCLHIANPRKQQPFFFSFSDCIHSFWQCCITNEAVKAHHLLVSKCLYSSTHSPHHWFPVRRSGSESESGLRLALECKTQGKPAFMLTVSFDKVSF